MWQALEKAVQLVAARGQLYVALYNDQGILSSYWAMVKKVYNRSRLGAFAMLTVHAPYFAAARVFGNVMRAVHGAPRDERGMRFWRDVVDWVGGYPFEVAGLQEVVRYLEGKNFYVERIKSVGRRSGCNEWVSRRVG
jgi:2-polyprenyl-6-hydroxyphenyl methylase/3-demethylubiquinone-9 3-methyltransferase